MRGPSSLSQRRSLVDGYRHLSDRGLVALMARNDAGALDALYTRYGQLSYGLALRMVRNEATAERVTSDSFVEVWRCAPELTAGVAGIRSRLLAAVHRLARQALRAGAGPRPGSPPDEEAPAWLHLERSEAEATLAQLRDGEREVIELAFYDGLNRAEIAQRLGSSVATVTDRIVAGMQTLQRLEAAGSLPDDRESAL